MVGTNKCVGEAGSPSGGSPPKGGSKQEEVDVRNMFREKHGTGKITQVVLAGTTGIEVRVTPVKRTTRVVCQYVPSENVTGGDNFCKDVK